MNTLRVLVCGGRDFNDVVLLTNKLDELAATPIALVIHGGARGADSLAGQWAKRNNIPVLVFEARWKEHGKSAGPRRNELMLHEGKPDLVYAFPGGVGTAHMVKISRATGVKVVEVKP